MKDHAPYYEKDWADDCDRKAKQELLACPDCGFSGDYFLFGPKGEGTSRHYRMCKKCGFWQKADGSSACRCWRSMHVCVRHVETEYKCAHCMTPPLRAEDTNGVAIHVCEWYLLPEENGYFCTTCADYIGREAQVPWARRGTD